MTRLQELLAIKPIGNVRPHASGTRPVSPQAADALTNLQDQVDRITRMLHDGLAEMYALLQTALAATGTPHYIEEFVLAAASTNITPTSVHSVGARLTVIITIDSTDGREIVWDALFKGVTNDDIDGTADMVNIYEFIGLVDGNWWCMGMRLGHN